MGRASRRKREKRARQADRSDDVRKLDELPLDFDLEFRLDEARILKFFRDIAPRNVPTSYTVSMDVYKALMLSEEEVK